MTDAIVDGAEQVTRYVAGFLFDSEHLAVALVEKKRPAWQAGKYNGVGGHIEDGETPAQAMRREFREETGFDVPRWEHFATLTGHGFEVVFFRATHQCFDKLADSTAFPTDEQIVCVPLYAIANGAATVISNLRWLVPMALPTSRHDWPYIVRECASSPDSGTGEGV